MNRLLLRSILLCFPCAIVFAQGEPQLALSNVEDRAYAGLPYTVEAVVTWSGASDEYIVGIPTWNAPEWGEITHGTAETYRVSEKNTYIYRLDVVASMPGAYELNGVKVPLLATEEIAAEGDAAAEIALVPALTLEAEAYPIEVAAPGSGNIGFLAGGGMAVLLLLGLAFWGWQRSKQSAQSEVSEEDPAVILNLARRHQLDGEYYEFYRALSRAATLSQGEAGAGLSQKFERRAQEVGFQGVRPTPEEMEGDLKEVERASRAVAPASPEHAGVSS